MEENKIDDRQTLAKHRLKKEVKKIKKSKRMEKRCKVSLLARFRTIIRNIRRKKDKEQGIFSTPDSMMDEDTFEIEDTEEKPKVKETVKVTVAKGKPVVTKSKAKPRRRSGISISRRVEINSSKFINKKKKDKD